MAYFADIIYVIRSDAYHPTIQHRQVVLTVWKELPPLFSLVPVIFWAN